MPIDPRLPSEIFSTTGSGDASTGGADPRRPGGVGAAPEGVARAASALRASMRSAGRHVGGLWRPGTIVEKYRIEELLGVGGFAAVYRATHMRLKMPVAIKHIRPDVLARGRDVAAQLVEEACAAARVRHPNVVQVFDVVEAPNLTYIVMEYIAGESLSDAIARRIRLPEAEVISVGIDVAQGLEATLAQGLIHRDIKPANILIATEGRARVVDLGLARAAAGGGRAVTDRAEVVGTRGYAAPEQLEDPSRVDFRADIYALGVTLGEALHGRGGPRRAPAPPAAGALEVLLRKMTSTDPQGRPSSYRQLLGELESARAAK